MNLVKADKYFSIYIRRRDADEWGEVKCCTCSNRGHWKLFDCGHFIPRGKLATRYDERNCHSQCAHCNRFLNGNLVKYEIFLRSKYGNEVVEELKIKSKESVKWMPHQIQEMTEEFKSKIKELK